MAKNLIRKVYDWNGSWTCPAGVKEIRIMAVKKTPFLGFAGSGHMLAIDSGGDMYAWGLGTSGQLGNGTFTSRSTPTLVVGGLKFSQCATGPGTLMSNSYGLTTTGDIYSWGSGTNGALGDGTGVSKSSPVLVAGGKKWKAVFEGAFAIDTNGDGWSWGFNGQGRLGDGTTTARNSPVQIVGGLKWLSFSVTNRASFGIDTNRDLYAWGNNLQGGLGVGDITNRSSPTLVVGGVKWLSVNGGRAGSSSGEPIGGISVDGDLYTWGAGSTFALGDGTTNSRSSPVLVVTGKKWKQIQPVGQNMLGIDSSGDLYAWGANTSGELGFNDNTQRSTPTLVPGGFKWKWIHGNTPSANYFSSGMTASGDLYVWGSNAYGQFGNNTVTHASSPTLVTGVSKIWSAIESTLTGEVMIAVEPGVTYDISMIGSFLTAAGEPIAAAGYNFNQVVLEYYA